MRSVNDLIPDVRLVAAGVPNPLALYALTRSLGEFLDRSEAWKEWVFNAVQYSDAYDTGGLLTIAYGETDERHTRIKRIESLRLNSDGEPIHFRTYNQLTSVDPMWHSREGTRPRYFTNAGESEPDVPEDVSQHAIRVYPIPASDTIEEQIDARVVLVTHSVTGTAFDDWDLQVPSIPDRIFYAFKEGIVAGALAFLLSMPGKDWTALTTVPMHTAKFESVIARASSRSDRDYGNAPLVVTYGGI